jgi:hypothetical protein
LENIELTQTSGSHASTPLCVECLEATTEPAVNLRGELLCAKCAADFYVACAACGRLIARDEAVEREDKSMCADCDVRATGVAPEDAPAEAEVEGLVAEYVRLHAEEKRIKERVDEIKERLKLAALFRQRVANSVTLRGEDGAVKCSYRTNWKCDDAKVAALADALDAETFASLFERSVKFSPVKDSLEKLLAEESDADANLRRLVAAAVEQSEQATLTVVRPKKS